MLRHLAFVSLLLLLSVPLSAQNSMRKLRAEPGPAAARAGSAIVWRKDLATALAEAKAQQKLVFWYVPTVARSPMDRKPEIDRYLRGGPFSWPSTIELLTQHFVPVDEIPRGALQKQYGLLRNQFIEPGYLVLDGDGVVKLSIDQLTSFQPEWFEAPLRRLVRTPSEGFPGAPALHEAWQAYRAGQRAHAIELADAVLAQDPAPAIAAEAHWLAGAALCRDNKRREANERWLQLAAKFPEQPLGWKAALEAEGHGPFGHGFEDYLPLPPSLLANDPKDGSRALAGTYPEAELWRRSVDFLLAMDDGDGCVRDSIYDFGGSDGLPNVYAAVTCLAGEALLAASDRVARGQLVLPAATTARLEAMLQRILQNVENESWLSLSDQDEILWARAYAVRFLVAWRARRSADAASLAKPLQRGVAALLALQPDTGVWFHEYGNPFASATALQALHGARAAGIEVSQAAIDRGLRALAMDRTDAGAFTYGHTPTGKPSESLEAAAGRMPLCELALFLFGASDQQKLTAAVATGNRHHALMAAVRKYDDHASPLHYGGFFFWFDMLGRADAIRQLEQASTRLDAVKAQRGLILELPEFDGCFVDSHELGRAYGTAMALLCLDALAASEVQPR